MSIYAVSVLFLSASVVFANVFGLYAGYNREGWLEKMAFGCGAVDIGSVAGLVIAIADAMSQIWVMRAGYEGWPVWGCLAAMIAATLTALGTGLAVIARENRWFVR